MISLQRQNKKIETNKKYKKYICIYQYIKISINKNLFIIHYLCVEDRIILFYL